MPSEIDPIESATKGAIKGALEWGVDFIKNLANRFKEKQMIEFFYRYEKETCPRFPVQTFFFNHPPQAV